MKPLHFSPTADFFEFAIPPRGDKYVIPYMSRLFMQLRLQKKDGTDLTQAQGLAVSSVCALGNSMWQTIETCIAGEIKSELIDQNVPYKSHIQNLLSYVSLLTELKCT